MFFRKVFIFFSLYFIVHFSLSSDLLIRNNSDLQTFRGFLSKIEAPESSLSEFIYAYFISSQRSIYEMSEYFKQHLVDFRSVNKFYRLHEIHILGATQLNDYIELWYGISERDYEDVGGAGGFFSPDFKHPQHKTYPVLHIKFKKDMDELFYQLDSFSKEIYEIYFICKKFKKCNGVSLRAATGLPPSYVHFLRENPYSLLDTISDTHNQLLLSVEVNDYDFNTIETVSYKFGLGSSTNYIWLEDCYRNNDWRNYDDRNLVTLLSPETLNNARIMLKWVLDVSQKKTYHRPCGRKKRQAFMFLYYIGCSFYDIKDLKPLRAVNHRATQGQYEIAFPLSTNTYVIFDFFARALNYPAIVLLIN